MHAFSSPDRLLPHIVGKPPFQIVRGSVETDTAIPSTKNDGDEAQGATLCGRDEIIPCSCGKPCLQAGHPFYSSDEMIGVG